MKKLVLIAVMAIALAAMSNPVAAQQASDETKLTYEVLTEEWGTLIGGVLDLTEAEGEAFWPVYKEYGKAKREIWNRRIDVIRIFMGSYNEMSPEMSRILLDQTFTIAKEKLELEMEYAEIFDDFLPPEKVTRLFQAENKLETTLMMQIVKDVPLAK